MGAGAFLGEAESGVQDGTSRFIGHLAHGGGPLALFAVADLDVQPIVRRSLRQQRGILGKGMGIWDRHLGSGHHIACTRAQAQLLTSQSVAATPQTLTCARIGGWVGVSFTEEACGGLQQGPGHLNGLLAWAADSTGGGGQRAVVCL